jgi:hypothetical protein
MICAEIRNDGLVATQCAKNNLRSRAKGRAPTQIGRTVAGAAVPYPYAAMKALRPRV